MSGFLSTAMQLRGRIQVFTNDEHRKAVLRRLAGAPLEGHATDELAHNDGDIARAHVPDAPALTRCAATLIAYRYCVYLSRDYGAVLHQSGNWIFWGFFRRRWCCKMGRLLTSLPSRPNCAYSTVQLLTPIALCDSRHILRPPTRSRCVPRGAHR